MIPPDDDSRSLPLECVGTLTCLAVAASGGAMDAFIGSVNFVAFSYALVGWALCHGQSTQISQYKAAYSLLGTNFGGDGIRTFNLPDLRGRMPMGSGQGPGLTERTIGQIGGAESFRLGPANVPPHVHDVEITKPVAVTVTHTVQTLAPADGGALTPTPPADSLITGSTTGLVKIFAPANATRGTHYPINDIKVEVEQPQMRAVAHISDMAPVPHLSPFAVLTAIICLEGEFPSRQ